MTLLREHRAYLVDADLRNVYARLAQSYRERPMLANDENAGTEKEKISRSQV